MDEVKLKKATFTPTEVLIKSRKGDIHITIDEIESIQYERFSLSWLANLILCPEGTVWPGFLIINLNGTKRKRRGYIMRIKSKDFYRLPKAYWRKTRYYDPSEDFE